MFSIFPTRIFIGMNAGIYIFFPFIPCSFIFESLHGYFHQSFQAIGCVDTALENFILEFLGICRHCCSDLVIGLN